MTNRYSGVNFLARGADFEGFWREYLEEDRKIKYIMGLGFDPRATSCLGVVRGLMGRGSMDCKVIGYGKGSSDPYLKRALERNAESLEGIIPKSEWNGETIYTADASKDTSLAASKSVSLGELEGYTDIILDINAMPSSVYFPITRNVLDWIGKGKVRQPAGRKVNFHMVVSENPKLDGAVRNTRIDEKITYMHKFAARLQSEARQTLPKIWIPLLGEGRRVQMSRVRRQVDRLVEFCPFFPMPSTDPYRCKNLLMEYRELLTDDLGISPKDYVYSSETNPFDVCTKIYNIAKRYYGLFEPLGGCQVVISPMSSKMMCVGALLAACSLLEEKAEVGVVYTAARGYAVEEDVDLDAESKRAVPHSVWLEGECYG